MMIITLLFFFFRRLMHPKPKKTRKKCIKRESDADDESLISRPRKQVRDYTFKYFPSRTASFLLFFVIFHSITEVISYKTQKNDWTDERALQKDSKITLYHLLSSSLLYFQRVSSFLPFPIFVDIIEQKKKRSPKECMGGKKKIKKEVERERKQMVWFSFVSSSRFLFGTDERKWRNVLREEKRFLEEDLLLNLTVSLFFLVSLHLVSQAVSSFPVVSVPLIHYDWNLPQEEQQM